MKSKKGSAFERDTCRLLSLWWTAQKRDDIFWRSAGSGARAKTRSKTGRSTFGQYGDIQCVDPIGSALTSVCTIELKRGYTKSTFSDAVEKPDKAAQQMFEKFLEQAITDSRNAKTPFWMLITRRDKKQSMVFIPNPFYKALVSVGSLLNRSVPFVKIRMRSKLGSKTKLHSIVGFHLDSFLESVSPTYIKILNKHETKTRKKS
jgi:hypothetical protein